MFIITAQCDVRGKSFRHFQSLSCNNIEKKIKDVNFLVRKTIYFKEDKIDRKTNSCLYWMTASL